jgi:uncharacterized membrane protein
VFGALAKMSVCSQGFTLKPRIDGIKFMETMNQRPGSQEDFDKYDYQAIEYINKNLMVIAPILETPGERLYSGVSRISIYTGMPGYMGWEYQVSQQSGRSEEVSRRERTGNMIYTMPSTETVLPLLKEEGLPYVYVGSTEKAKYYNFEKFEGAGKIVYQNEGSKLYKINLQ